MTDVSASPEMPDAAQTAYFLRRFAGMMSSGQNATYLLHAAGLIDSLTSSLASALNEEKLWRYKYETMTDQNDLLEAECDSLKHDIEGHVNITSSILSERDTLKAALEAEQAELREANAALSREREQSATKSGALESAMAGLRAGFDLERLELKAIAEVRGKEVEQVRRVFERERDELRAQLTSREEELAALRAASEREADTLKTRLAALEAKRAEIRSAFDRIGDLRIQAAGPAEHADPAAPVGFAALDAGLSPTPSRNGKSASDTASTVVPRATLKQAKAQFEYLAKDCTRRGDIATQVMCELGAYTLELALDAAERTPRHFPVGEIALGILAPGPAAPAVAEQRSAASG